MVPSLSIHSQSQTWSFLHSVNQDRFMVVGAHFRNVVGLSGDWKNSYSNATLWKFDEPAVCVTHTIHVLGVTRQIDDQLKEYYTRMKTCTSKPCAVRGPSVFTWMCYADIISKKYNRYFSTANCIKPSGKRFMILTLRSCKTFNSIPHRQDLDKHSFLNIGASETQIRFFLNSKQSQDPVTSCGSSQWRTSLCKPENRFV